MGRADGEGSAFASTRVPSAWMYWMAHSACVGIFHNKRLEGDTRSRYSGKLVAMGKRPKKAMPALNVADFTSNQIGITEVTRIVTPRTPSKAFVRVGLRHS